MKLKRLFTNKLTLLAAACVVGVTALSTGVDAAGPTYTLCNATSSAWVESKLCSFYGLEAAALGFDSQGDRGVGVWCGGEQGSDCVAQGAYHIWAEVEGDNRFGFPCDALTNDGSSQRSPENACIYDDTWTVRLLYHE